MAHARASSDHFHAVTASFLGWTLDAFDFFIVTFVLTDIGKEFGRSRVEMAGVLTMTLAMRPIGAFIFGLMADRYGRRLPLMIDLVFFSVIEVASGFAQTYTQFLILRALFGIGMGGEWGVGASLAMEKAPSGQRGLLSGLLQEGYATGNLLAALCYLFVYPHLGWRPMFFIGGIPALLAVYVRFGVTESEVWKKTKSQNWSHLGRAVVSHWKLFLLIFAMMTAMNFVSHGTQDLFPTFLKVAKGFDPKQVAYMGIVYNIGAILGGLAMGYYSDRIGRRRSMITSLLLATAVIPLWVFAPTTGLLVAGAFLMQFMVQGAWGVVPAHINELAPDAVRGFLPGFAYQCGVAVAGVAPTLQEHFAKQFSMASVMAVSCGAAFLVAAFIVKMGHEKHGTEFGVTT
jgi:SHS family lactate transporter-like MFS transporter